MSTTRRRLAATTVAVMTGATLMASASAPPAVAAEPVLTDFAMTANGWSTLLTGGDLPVRSGRTGFAIVGCTRFAFKSNQNNTAAVTFPAEGGEVFVGATTTNAFTDKNDATVSSNALNDVARVIIGDKSQQALEIEGIKTRVRAFHDRSGYHRSAVVRVADVTRYVNGVPTDVLTVPSNTDLDGEQVEVPGVATVTFGIKSGSATSRSARAQALALRIDFAVTDTVLRVGQASARIDGGAVAGIMGGSVWGSRLTGLDGVANSGRTALQVLPCVGTNGKFRVNQVAEVSIPDTVRLDTVTSKVKGDQDRSAASAKGVSTITRAGFGSRDLVITGIEAVGEVVRRSDGSYVRSSRGTTLGSIVFQGEKRRIPQPGETLTIPGVARITPSLVDRTSVGIRVIAVRVELLQGSEVQSTLDLGNVKLGIRRG
ncbi:MAG: hypothetical protein M3P83_03055 [Actinomycetota bacterium]|nr:hypothetical protein [Actinomycetota bacterium]